MPAKWTAVLPRAFREDKMRFVLLRALEAQGQVAIELFKKTTSTWEEHDPEFEVSSIRAAKDEWSVTVGTDDEIYGYLNYGTSERLVRLSPDWQSKTAPGRFIPTAGQGQVLGEGVFPGIEARHFDEMVEERMEGDFQDAMIKVLEKVAHASGHGGII